MIEEFNNKMPLKNGQKKEHTEELFEIKKWLLFCSCRNLSSLTLISFSILMRELSLHSDSVTSV